MKIKATNDTSSFLKKARIIFSTRKRVIMGLFGLAGLIAIIILFFAALGLGAYQNKIAQDNYYEPALLKIANFDFSSLKNTIDGRSNGFEHIKVNLEPKDLDQIRKIQENIIEEGMVTEAMKRENFPAKLTYLGKIHDVVIGLAGNMAIHFNDPLKWSFQVKTIGDDTVEDMKRFNLWLPSTGEYLTDWLAIDLMEERGIKCLKGDFVKVSVNGKAAGIFYMEERFEQELLNHNRFEEGILFKIEKGMVSPATGYEESSAAKAKLIQLRQKWQDLVGGRIPIKEFFDLKKMGQLFAHMDLMNREQNFLERRSYFYFDPLSGLAEPIATEFKNLNDTRSFPFELFVEPPGLNSEKSMLLAKDSMMLLLHNHLGFKRFYLEEAEFISQEKIIDQLLTQNGDQLNYLAKKVYHNWPANELPMAALYGKAKYMRYILNPDIEEISAYLNHKTKDHLMIDFQNHQDLPIEVTYLNWRDSIFFYPRKTIILSPHDKTKAEAPPVYEFQMPPHFSWSDTLLPELKVSYSILGLQAGEKNTQVFPWSYETSLQHFGNPVAGETNYKTFNFIKELEDSGTLSIPAGIWTLSRDLIIPKNKRFQIEAGAQIDLINHAKIISYAPLFCLGNELDPVTVKSSDATGEGFIIIRAGQESELVYTNFEQLSCPEDQGWKLSGAITFYESPVSIRSCNFSTNLRGDDFLNIVRTEFSMEQVSFRNILADAFDCDFCTGSIKNSFFINIGNDGIDVSGTKLEVSQVQMEFIGDKGLSAGENSELRAEWIEIRNAEIGVTSKDRSTVFLSDSKLIDNKIGITLFEKKSEYGPANMHVERVKILNSEILYLVEQHSSLTVDGIEFLTKMENVKDILYGVEFGKSSK